MKCSQCGGEKLAKVKFPHEVELMETVVGLAGYSACYDLNNEVHCNTYICLNCGHFEFFNLKLAEQIKQDKKDSQISTVKKQPESAVFFSYICLRQVLSYILLAQSYICLTASYGSILYNNYLNFGIAEISLRDRRNITRSI